MALHPEKCQISQIRARPWSHSRLLPGYCYWCSPKHLSQMGSSDGQWRGTFSSLLLLVYCLSLSLFALRLSQSLSIPRSSSPQLSTFFDVFDGFCWVDCFPLAPLGRLPCSLRRQAGRQNFCFSSLLWVLLSTQYKGDKSLVNLWWTHYLSDLEHNMQVSQWELIYSKNMSSLEPFVLSTALDWIAVKGLGTYNTRRLHWWAEKGRTLGFSSESQLLW